MQDPHLLFLKTHPALLHFFLVAFLITAQGVHTFPSFLLLTNTQLMLLQDSLSPAMLHDVHSLLPFGQLHPVLLQAFLFLLEIVGHCKHSFFFQIQPKTEQVCAVPDRQMSPSGSAVGSSVVGLPVVGLPVIGPPYEGMLEGEGLKGSSKL